MGIDIGTTTTQLIFSRITLENIASFGSAPKITIVDKEIIYRSKIHFTPLISYNEIDYDSIVSVVDEEYKAAGIAKEELSTGAVIITGETSRKDNADKVLRLLSSYAGDFVVATAGPDLESILAAKGAGVHLLSKKSNSTIANFDIGGGTTNIALFKHGQLVDTSCLDIGGRLIKVEGGKISYIAPAIQQLATQKGIPVAMGDVVNADSLMPIVNAMANVLYEEKFSEPIDSVTFSGGVADAIYAPEAPNNVDPFMFNDIGILLGRAIANCRLCKDYTVLQPQETIRATVIGAGIHTMELSGSTIEYTEGALPVQNVPIIKLTDEEEQFAGDCYPNIADAVSKKISWYKNQTVAISFKGTKNPSYPQIQALCASLYEGLKNYDNQIIIVVEMDMAKVLGQTMRILTKNTRSILCIDNVSVSNGDYIDCGMPLSQGQVVPVVIKTLTF